MFARATEDEVYEGTSNNIPVYFVWIDRGDYELTFNKKTLTFKKVYVADAPVLGGEWYKSTELNLFREDYPGVFEYACKLLSQKTGRKVQIPSIKARNSTKAPSTRTTKAKKIVRKVRK